MPWYIARISTRISYPRTNSCKVSHTHQGPDQLIGEKASLREVFWDLIDVGENNHTMVLSPRIACDTDPRELEILGQREGEQSSSNMQIVTAQLLGY